MSIKQSEVAEHFDKTAAQYDYWKNKNWYYYKELKMIARQYTKNSDYVLDAGCGTGAVLRALNIRGGMGIDISPKMIAIAKKRSEKNKNLSFFVSDIVNLDSDKQFNVVLLLDVIEHVSEPKQILEKLKKIVKSDGVVVLTMANPLWEPILILGEKYGFKMAEGPHYRLPSSQLIKIARRSGFVLIKHQWQLLLPKYIPLVSWLINDFWGRLPIIRRLGVIEILIFKQSL